MTLLVVDKRKRVSLGALAHHGQYLAQGHPDGTIVLTPARVIPEKAFAEMARYAEKSRQAEDDALDDPPF